MTFTDYVELVGKAIDASGVAVIVIGAAIATYRFGGRLRDRQEFTTSYRLYRQGLGRAILLGLEFLVAADIIRTVAVAPTIQSAAVLAIIVGIRTFLSFSLEVELEGRLPWRSREAEPSARAGTRET